MEPVCQGCVLGFHSPEAHLPEPARERAARMYALIKVYNTPELIEERYLEGLLTRTEKEFVLRILSEQEVRHA